MLRSFAGWMGVGLLGWPALSLAAQPSDTCRRALTVYVSEAHTAALIPDAFLHVVETGARSTAADRGALSLAALCPGTYTIHVGAPGHEEAVLSLALGAADTAIRVTLEHDAHALAEVQVAAARAPVTMQSSTAVEGEAFRAATAGRTVTEGLEGVPGVALQATGGTIAKPMIHGLSGARVVTVVAGIRQEDGQWGGEHALAIDAGATGSVTVVRGAAGVRWGPDALGGVIVVEPRPFRTAPGWGGEATATISSAARAGSFSGLVEHRSAQRPSWAFRAGGTVRRGGTYRLPGGIYAANTAYAEGAGHAALAYRRPHFSAVFSGSRFATSLGLYRGSHAGSAQDLERAIASPVPLVPGEPGYTIGRPRGDVTHDAFSARLEGDARLGRWNTVLGFQHNRRQEYDVQRVPSERPQLDLRLRTLTATAALEHRQLFGRLRGTVGAEGILQSQRFANGDRRFLPYYDAAGGGAFLHERLPIGRWTAEAGLRADVRHYDVLNPEGKGDSIVRYTPCWGGAAVTLGMRRSWSGGSAAAVASSGWRAPQAVELYASGLHNGAARIEIGNVALDKERALGLSVDGQHVFWNGRLSLWATVYHQRLAGYIYLRPGAPVLTIRGAYKSFAYAQTDAAISGADFTARAFLTPRLEARLTASLLRGRDRSATEPLILMPPDRALLSARYTLPDGRAVRGCYAEVSAKAVARQTRIPRGFDTIDAPRPPAGYFVLGAEAGARLGRGGHPMELALTVQNALDRRYRDYLDAFRYYLDRPGIDLRLRLTRTF